MSKHAVILFLLLWQLGIYTMLWISQRSDRKYNTQLIFFILHNYAGSIKKVALDQYDASNCTSPTASFQAFR